MFMFNYLVKVLLIIDVVVLSSALYANNRFKVVENLNSDNRKCILEPIAESGIGDVKFSILNEEEFRKVNGKEWVQMKGQSISKTGLVGQTKESYISYYINSHFYGAGDKGNDTKNLPDANRRFLRIIDQDKTRRKLGSSQIDRFQGHKHGLTQEGGHSNYNAPGNSPSVFGGNSTAYNSSAVKNPSDDGINGVPRTSNETRPMNIAVNAYVKVKRKCVESLSDINSIKNDVKNMKLNKAHRTELEELRREYNLLKKILLSN